MTRARWVLAAAASAALLAAMEPAYAQLTVFDPANYAQNLLTAARSLQQVQNQIVQLQNQAQMLLNQSRNLANLPTSVLAQIQGDITRTQQLLAQAQNITFNATQINTAFSTQYGTASLSSSNAALVARAQQRWTTSVGAFQDSLLIGAGVVGNVDGARTQANSLVTSSQAATGALQAAQAGNQLLAVQSQQLADLTAIVAAIGRAQALDSADKASALSDAAVRFQNFLGNSAGYTPGNVAMFH